MGFDKMLIVGGSVGPRWRWLTRKRTPNASRASYCARCSWAQTRRSTGRSAARRRELRPDLYEGFVAALPEDERADPLKAYVSRG